MMRLYTKLKILKGKLKEWSGTNFSDLQGKVQAVKVELERIQVEIQIRPLDYDLARMENVDLTEYNKLVKAEHSSIKQKAGSKWAELGDDNTSFFHKVVQGNKGQESQARTVPRQPVGEYPVESAAGT
ncbi:Ribonuclease h domain [Thalictrum thalictroides]|uniref:Ribonuclease h domain n=1 Tax=Thalictrum thalictroides TaxID=46969 RepID=A0A7J6VTT6_THATH|nr:Ribonuclease h domain [Thalictrum thalictroides]